MKGEFRPGQRRAKLSAVQDSADSLGQSEVTNVFVEDLDFSYLIISKRIKIVLLL